MPPVMVYQDDPDGGFSGHYFNCACGSTLYIPNDPVTLQETKLEGTGSWTTTRVRGAVSTLVARASAESAKRKR